MMNLKQKLNNFLNWFFPIFPTNSSKELKEVVKFIRKKYGLKNIKFVSKKSIHVLIDKSSQLSRKELITNISKNENFVYEGKGSSIGRIKYKDIISIYIKPLELQGDHSPGKQNEKIFEENIKKYLKKKPYICIQYPGHHWWIDNVTEITNNSLTGGNKSYKSDFSLICNNGRKINLSLKQINHIWESSITRYKYIYDKFIFNFINGYIPNLVAKENTELPGKYIMLNPNNDKPYGKIIIKGFPDYDDENIIFGNEVPKPVIIEQDFKPSDFTYNKNTNTLKINVNYWYENIDDVKYKNKLPVLTFTRDMSKPYGVQFKCIPEDKTIHKYKANILEIPYDVFINL